LARFVLLFEGNGLLLRPMAQRRNIMKFKVNRSNLATAIAGIGLALLVVFTGCDSTATRHETKRIDTQAEQQKDQIDRTVEQQKENAELQKENIDLTAEQRKEQVRAENERRDKAAEDLRRQADNLEKRADQVEKQPAPPVR
jgi:uncharacterized membrane protein YgaE (UPF0421/DUF939 family)